MMWAALLLSSSITAAEWIETTVRLSAYCPCVLCCGSRAAGLTADGTDVRDSPYGIAADPKVFSYGTQIYIPPTLGYMDNSWPLWEDQRRILFVDDTGGIIRRKTRQTGMPYLDLRFVRHASAVKFGVKYATVYVWKE